jgi:phenylpropionate dioxygenase-like ring-hydroxylating dioxygenase large terminal subunit
MSPGAKGFIVETLVIGNPLIPDFFLPDGITPQTTTGRKEGPHLRMTGNVPQNIRMKQLSSGHWYPALSSRELSKRPLARTRFGARVVFWRDDNGRASCMEDRCAHRGAALSLGRVRGAFIECPFHGFCYDRQGKCRRVPAEGEEWPIPETLRVETWTTRELSGYIWVWRGPAVGAKDLPPLPVQPVLTGLSFGETHYTWHNHYSRCIENVLDYSHLPFVHRRTLGAFIRDPVTKVEIRPFEGGFNFYRVSKDSDRQFVEFVYPTLWANRVGKNYVMAATFVPIDETHTEVYVRWYHKLPRFLTPLTNALGRLSQRLVFMDDLAIVASQRPRNVDTADHDHLVPSDGGILAYRKLRRAHQEDSMTWPAAIEADRPD